MEKKFLKITKQVTGGGLRAIFAFALFSILLTSCPNSADDSYSPPAQPQQAAPSSPSAPATTVPAGGTEAASEIQYITFKGSVQEAGALPASYAKPIDDLFALAAAAQAQLEGGQVDVARSASPDATVKEGGDFEFFATATAREDGTVEEGKFESAISSDFEMKLAVGKTWDIVCGVRKKAGGAVVFQDTFSKQVTVEDSALKHDFELIPVQAGSGSVSLAVNFSAPAVKVEARWEKDYGIPALSSAGGTESPAWIKAEGVPCGNYNIVILIKDANNISLYESVQTVTVLNGLETNTWTLESGEGAITQDGDSVTFNVGGDLIKNRASKWIYVGVPADLKDQGVTARDSNGGGAYEPLEHLQAAFDKIQSSGSADKDFQIFVSGEIVGNSELGSGITCDSGGNAKSITIQGLDSGGNPKAALKGDRTSSVLTIASSVPVTLKNIQITGGRAASGSGGGGISMASGSKVTLGQGALIGKPTDQAIMDYDNCGNSGNKGGGILVDGASLVLESGSSVQGNYGSGGLGVGSGGGGISVINGGSLVIGEGAEVCKNASSGPGGGIFVGDNSSVTVNGGIVNQNEASNYGGGFYLDAEAAAAPARLELNGGQINQNAAIGKQYIGVAKGGGIYASKNGQIQIKGGQINNNSAGKETTSPSGHTYGAGVYICASTAQMTNGEISENEGYAVRDMDRHCGSAVAVMEDAEFSISGGTISKNKIAKGEKLGAIYVKSEKKTVGGSDVVVKGTLKISGSPSIPYDSGDNAQNYVYLEAEDSRSGISEQAKERIYSPIKVGNLTGGSVAASVCAQNWLRGKQVLLADGVSDLTPLKDKLAFVENGISFAVPTAEKTKATLMSPFYVSDTGGSDDASCPGTYDRPYKTFAHAIGEIVSTNAAADYTIRIKGKVSGAQAIVADTITSANCTGLTIEGTTALGDSGLPTDILDRGLAGGTIQDDGSALVVNTTVPVTIQKLKITGGRSSLGGGINVGASGATVRLCDGAWIAGNGANPKGGGVAVANGAALYMYGKALIGDLTETVANGSGSGKSANHVFGKGGGIYNEGSLYIGYEPPAGGSPMIQHALSTGFGVRYNYSNGSDDGGGIYSTGSVLLNSGVVSYNCGAGIAIEGGTLDITGGEICANSGSYGGGVRVEAGSATMSGGTIGGADGKGNDATHGGGAVYVQYGKTFKMTGGTISYNKQTGSISGGGGGGAVYINMSSSSGGTSTYGTFEMTGGVLENNSAASGNGGAVFNQGILKLSGKASIPYADGKNDVYLYGSRTITTDSFDASAPETVATISMPDGSWARGRQVLDGSVSDTIAGMFKTIDPDFKLKASSSTEGIIYAPIIVAQSGSAIPESEQRGTHAKPFPTLSRALTALDAQNDTITVVGTLTGLQTISSPSVSLSLTGEDGGTIDAGSAGSALTVAASGKTVTITDLTITGGNATGSGNAGYGGGIKVESGTVKLANGAKIAGNKATNGGGVWVSATGTLYMSGTALIGDDYAGTAASSTLNLSPSSTNVGCANFASMGGGIFNNGGNVYIGCDSSGNFTDTSASYALGDGYGVRRNYSSGVGGGIYQVSPGTIKFGSGCVSYNHGANGGGFYLTNNTTLNGGTMEGNKADVYGGAIYINTSKTITISGALALKSNEAVDEGGAIYNEGTLTMSAGTIGGSGAQNKVTASNGKGGAIYNGGTFNISGSAYVYSGSEKTNDVYLADGKYVTVADTLTPPSGVASVATISPYQYKRGYKIITTSSSSLDLDDVKTKFAVAQDNSDWEKEKVTESYKDYISINSPIYVVDANDPDNSNKTRPSGFNKGVTTGATGTKSKPYASIAAAATASDLNAAGCRITVAGTLTGAQTISSVTSGVTALTLSGYKTTSAKTASKIDGKGAASTTALTINKSGLAVTIQNYITITGGNANGSGNAGKGGGINIASGTVTLGDDAKITGNMATSGGGVYVGASGVLFMRGKSLIADQERKSGIVLADGSDPSKYANRGQTGGGIYNDGKVYIGYDGFESDGTTPKESAMESFYGVIRNFGVNGGAGIYNNGTLKIASGEISYNKCSTDGGGIYFAAGSTLSGGSVQSNQASNGGGIYIQNGKTVTLDCDTTIADTDGISISSNTATNGSNGCGGGAFVAGSLIMTGGSFTSNKVSDDGGMGGAIYQNGTLTVSKEAFINPPSTIAERSNDVYLPSGKTVKLGSDELTKNKSDKKIYITPANWKRGDIVLSGSNITTEYVKFGITDTDWKVGYYVSGTATEDNAKRIGSDLWVAGTYNNATLSSGVGNKATTGGKVPSDSNRGTKKQPYETIKKAVEQCWDTSRDFTITVDGCLGGAQTVPAAVTTTTPNTGLAASIKIVGNNASAKLDGGFTSASASGTVLTIATATPVTLDIITITGGKKTGNGGGVNHTNSSGTLKLGTSLKVQGNSASAYGGGIYSDAAIDFIGAATIGGSSANKNTARYGAGICSTKSLTFTMNGNISYNEASYISSGLTYWGNGGGIYSTGDVSLSHSTLKIQNNKAGSGGGVYITGSKSLSMSGGTISSNEAIATTQDGTEGGGGVYVGGGATFYMSGGTISSNKCPSSLGGGVLVCASKFFMWQSAVIGDSGKGLTTYAASFDECSNSATYGGGLAVSGASSVGLGYTSATGTETGNNFTGGIHYNYASRGGGIYNLSTNSISIGSSGNKGNLHSNGANAYGGAIYCHMNGSNIVLGQYGTIFGGGPKKNDVYLGSGKSISFTTNSSVYHSESTPIYVTPNDWSATKTIVSAYASNHCAKISVTDKSDGTKWSVNTDGKMLQGATVSPANAAAAVATLTKGGTLKLTSNPTAQQILDIRDALYALNGSSSGARVKIDLSATTLTSIPANAFYDSEKGSAWGSGCAALESVALPTTVTSLGDRAFRGCDNLTSITGYSNVKTYGESALAGTKISSWTFPSGTTTISKNLFDNASSLTSVVIPDSVTTIKEAAFSISGLTSISIPTSVTTIEGYAFNYCNFSSLTIPNSVTSLGRNFASNCRNLTSVTFSNKITAIPQEAFYTASAWSETTKLSSITIPSWITSIGVGAFQGCTQLTSVTFADTSKTWKAGGINYSVTSPATNATNLKDKWNYEWTKN